MAQWQLSGTIYTALSMSAQARQYQLQAQTLSAQCEGMHRQADIMAERIRYEYEQHIHTLECIAEAFEVSLYHNRCASQQLTQLCVGITHQLSALTQYLTDSQMSAEQLVQLNVLLQTLHQQQSALIASHGLMGEHSVDIYRSSGQAIEQLYHS